MESDKTLQGLGELDAVLRLTPGVGIARQIVGVGQVIDARQHGAREGLAIGDHPAHRNATEAHAVIAPLPADEAKALPLAPGPVIGQDDLERRVDSLGAGVDEESVVQAAGREFRDLVSQLESTGVAHVEGGGVVQLAHLLPDGSHDAGVTMADVDAPEPGDTVQDLLAVLGGVIHPSSGFQQQRVLLEIPVGG